MIFISYRWLGETQKHPQSDPDDASRTQWHRIVNAIDEYVKKKKNEKIDVETFGIWLVGWNGDDVTTTHG